MEKQITIAGAGMGSLDGMTAEVISAVREAQLLIGAARITDPLRGSDRRVCAEYRPDHIRRIVETAEEEIILILVTGDPGFYSAAAGIEEQLSDYEPRILPGISSLAYFSSKIRVPYSEASLVSAHGREVNIASIVRRNRITFILAGGNLLQLLTTLCRYGYSELEVRIGENLSSEKERIRSGTATELLRQAEQTPFSVLSLFFKASSINRWFLSIAKTILVKAFNFQSI